MSLSKGFQFICLVMLIFIFKLFFSNDFSFDFEINNISNILNTSNLSQNFSIIYNYFLNNGFPEFYVVLFLVLCLVYTILNINNFGIFIHNFLSWILGLFKQNKGERFNSDLPIEAKHEDKLGLNENINKITNILIGGYKSILINGKWGDGKTSLYNLIKNDSKIKKNFEILEFNPWTLSIEKNILSAFFEQLSLRFPLLENSSSNLKKIITSEDKSFGVLDFIFGTDNIEKYKGKINSRFKYKKLLVVVDDLDRLEDIKKIHEVLKLVGEFQKCENIQFLFLFDRNYIEQKIGNGFLDKIINYSFQVNISRKNLEEYMTLEYKEYTGKGLGFSYFGIEDGLWRFNLKNLREVKLLMNKFIDRLKILSGEVDTEQLFELTILEVFYPEFYKFIFENKKILLSSYSIYGTKSYKIKDDERIIKEILEEKLEEFQDLEKDYILDNILKRLFPNIDRAFGGNPAHKTNLEGCMGEQNIDHQDFFDKYFLFKIPEEISDIVLSEKLLGFHKLSKEEKIEFIESQYKFDRLSRVRGFKENFDHKMIQESIFFLIELINTKSFTLEEKTYLYYAIAKLIQVLIDELFHSRISTSSYDKPEIEKKKLELYKRIIDASKNNLFTSIFVSYYMDKSGWNEMDYKIFYNKISEYFTKKILRINDSKVLYFGLDGEDKKHLFFNDVGLGKFLDENDIEKIKKLK